MQVQILPRSDPAYPGMGSYLSQEPWYDVRRMVRCGVRGSAPRQAVFREVTPWRALQCLLQSEIRRPRSLRTPWVWPSAIYVQALCRRDRLLLRVDNEITAGRVRATKRTAKISEGTKTRRPDMLSRFTELIQWAQTPLAPEAAESLFSRD